VLYGRNGLLLIENIFANKNNWTEESKSNRRHGKLQNERLHTLYSSSNTVRVVRPRRAG
jgi:hypothetical protein